MTDVLEGPRSLVLVYSVESHRKRSVFVIWSPKFFLFLLIYQQFQEEVSAVLSPFLLIVIKVPAVTSRNNITLHGSEILK